MPVPVWDQFKPSASRQGYQLASCNVHHDNDHDDVHDAAADDDDQLNFYAHNPKQHSRKILTVPNRTQRSLNVSSLTV